MALLGIIRRWYIRDRISIREIARRLDISRNTVRRYIRSNAIEPSYPTRRSASALDPFTARLSAWLAAEAAKSRKQRRTLKQMFLDLKELGYQGSYDRVAAFGRQWKVGQLERVSSASKSTMDGKILFRCADPFSFATIEMFEDEVRSWLTERRSYTMNVPMHISTAAKFLGVKQQVMYQLVANGFVPALLHVIRGHYYRGVNIRDLDRFREKYVSLAELARDEGTSPSHMMKKILVSPVTGPSIDGCRQYFYLRASLCSRNKGD